MPTNKHANHDLEYALPSITFLDARIVGTRLVVGSQVSTDYLDEDPYILCTTCDVKVSIKDLGLSIDQYIL